MAGSCPGKDDKSSPYQLLFLAVSRSNCNVSRRARCWVCGPAPCRQAPCWASFPNCPWLRRSTRTRRLPNRTGAMARQAGSGRPKSDSNGGDGRPIRWLPRPHFFPNFASSDHCRPRIGPLSYLRPLAPHDEGEERALRHADPSSPPSPPPHTHLQSSLPCVCVPAHRAPAHRCHSAGHARTQAPSSVASCGSRRPKSPDRTSNRQIPVAVAAQPGLGHHQALRRRISSCICRRMWAASVTDEG
jgi:hypothetical protein